MGETIYNRDMESAQPSHPQPHHGSISHKRLRTFREKFYFRGLFILTLGIWLWLLFSIFRQFSGLVQEGDYKDGCYVRDQLNDKVTQIDSRYLLRGEICLQWLDLTSKEQEQVEEAERDVIDRVAASLTTPVLLLGFSIGSLFLHYFSIAYVRMNAVKVAPDQFPEIWETTGKIAQQFGMKHQPDVFVMLGQGMLNAFATKLIFRKFIIIYAELADALVEEKDHRQLEAVLAHEVGHHVLGHTRLIWEYFFMPIAFVPFLMLPLSRAREYSADRAMKALMEDTSICHRAMVKLAAGKKYGNRVNVSAYTRQIDEEGGFFAWLAEKFSTHPHLPNRLEAISRFKPINEN